MTRDELAKTAESQWEQVEIQKKIVMLNANIALYENLKVGLWSSHSDFENKSNYLKDIKIILKDIKKAWKK